MTPKERVYKALAHQEPDRVPWGEHSIDYNVYEDLLGRPTLVAAKMRETQALWDGRRDEVVACHKRDRIDLLKALDMDLLHVHSVPPKGYKPQPLEKLSDDTYRDKRGNLYRVSSTTHDLMMWQKADAGDYVMPTVEGLQQKIDEMESRPRHDPRDSHWPWDPNDSQWEYVRHAVKEVGQTHFIALLCGDTEFPRFGPTEEDSWMNLVTYPEIAAKLAEYDGKRIIRQLDTYAKLGVDAVMPCGDLGSSTGLMANPAIYKEMVFPWHKKYCERAHELGLKVIKHCCGHVWPIIHELASIYDAWEGIQATAGMDIGNLKAAVGSRLTLWGGIWHEHIILGGVQDIRADARYAFEHAAKGGGYIMGSTHSLAVDARKENILEMKRVRDQWGTYPIDTRKFV